MIQWPNIGLWGEFSPCEEGIVAALNSNIKILDTLVQMRLLDFVTELPLDPTPGDRYILEDDSYTYSESGSVIAVWDGEKWRFITPQTGYLGFVLATNGLYWFNGSDWVELPINPVQGPYASIDREIAVFDGITGKWITGSGVIIDIDKKLYAMNSIYVDNLILDDNNLYSDNGEMNAQSQLNTNDKLLVKKQLELYINNNTSTGSSVKIDNPETAISIFTSAGLLSLAGITPGKSKFVILTNKKGSSLTIKHLFGDAGSQIDTGLDGDLDMENNSTIILYEDTVSSVWRIVGGSGGGGACGGGAGLVWYGADGFSSPSEVYRGINPSAGINFPSKYLEFTGDEIQYIFCKIKLNGYKAGKNVVLKNGKVITASSDVAKDILFRAYTRLMINGDPATAVTSAQDVSVNVEVDVAGTAEVLIPLGDINLSFDGQIGGVDLVDGAEILVTLTRLYPDESFKCPEYVYLSVDENNNAFDLDIASKSFNT